MILDRSTTDSIPFEFLYKIHLQLVNLLCKDRILQFTVQFSPVIFFAQLFRFELDLRITQLYGRGHSLALGFNA